jgi:hypothetical protein
MNRSSLANQSDLTNTISRTVMQALFGQDAEVEVLLKFVRDRYFQ